MKKIFNPGGLLLSCFLLLTACIGDDLVFDEIEPTIRIINPVVSLKQGTTHQFEVKYFNNVGIEESISNVQWSSSRPEIISVDVNGLATALVLGTSVITAEYELNGALIMDSNEVLVSDETVNQLDERTGEIRSTSSYTLEGSFSLSGPTNDLLLSIGENYRASSALPGLYVFLSNNPNSTAEALEIGRVEVFEGAHSYKITNAGLNDYEYLLYYCKPFNVKVGDGKLN